MAIVDNNILSSLAKIQRLDLLNQVFDTVSTIPSVIEGKENTRTYVAKITNHQQVRGDLNQCGFSTSKLWNVGRYYTQQRWDDDGDIPDEAELKSELKDHERYSDLHSQSSQRVLEELAEAFTGWYNSDDGNNPPGYRNFWPLQEARHTGIDTWQWICNNPASSETQKPLNRTYTLIYPSTQKSRITPIPSFLSSSAVK